MPTLELQMIVKDGDASLARCLKSVEGIADRITLGDTGSTDDTLEIATQFGTNIISIPWNKDFAQARNAVLAHARADWVLFLDADEMLDPSAVMEIPGLIADATTHAYDLTVWNYVQDPGFRSNGEQARPNPLRIPHANAYPAYFRTSRTSLFRVHPGVHFEHCVHETVAGRVADLGFKRQPAPTLIHHFGYVEDARENRASKETLYFNLALKKAASAPQSSQANLDAGIAQLDHAKDPAAALPYLAKALELAPRRATAWLYAGIALTRLDRAAEALTHLDRASALEPGNPLTQSCLGDVYLKTNQHAQAHAAYSQAISLGDRSPLTLAKAGAAEVHLGRHQTGLAKVERALQQSPQTPELYDLYATAAFLAGDPSAACEAASHRLSLPQSSAFNYLLAATLHLHTGLRPQAESILQHGISQFPGDPELTHVLRQLEQG